MLFIEYSLETQVSGFLTLLCILFAFLMGGFVLKKAIKTKEKILFYFFFTIVLGFSPWYSIALGYLMWFFTKEALSYELHIILNLVFIPIGYLAWLNIYMSAVSPKRKKIVILINGIFSIMMEIYMFYFLYIAPNAPVEPLLGSVYELQPTYAGFLIIYSLILVLIILITGVHFSLFSIKRAYNNEIRWRGRFLLIAFVLFFIQVSLDVIILNTLIFFIILLRIVLLVNIALFYCGFILPNWMKRILNLEKEA